MKDIVIVGGGSGGWMAAIAIASRFPDKRITVVDSSVVGPIGVGESVTGVVMDFVLDPIHGLDIRELFRRCDATFKMGIWYKDWRGIGTEYLTPIDSPPIYFQHRYETHAEDFYAMAAADGVKLGEVQLYGMLMRRNQTDQFRNPDGTVNAQLGHASCHFDALKFAAWVREVTVKKPNVLHVDDFVEGFEQDPATGFVTRVRTKSGREIEGDLFIDCTGFHRQLFKPAYHPKWRSYADYIKVDSAIPCFQDYAPDQPMPSYTLATAMPHGWMWQIPTQSRLGRGYIFSSKYITPEQAITEFRAAGVKVGDNPRVLHFEPGRFEKQWEGNVCAIGLAGVFSEPLESSTIHGMFVQIKLLTELFLPNCSRESMPVMARQYNDLVASAYDDYMDFISFHYQTGRSDTEFWRDYQKPESMTPANQFRIERWKYAFPSREDFAPVYTQIAAHNTGLVIWAPMLCGLGFFRQEHARRMVSHNRNPQRIKENVNRYLQIRERILSTALSQSEAIAYFRDQH